MRELKILMTSYTFHPDIGGVTSFNSDLCTALVAMCHDVTLATLTPGSTEGFPYKVMRRPSSMDLAKLAFRSDINLLSNLSLNLALPLLPSPKPLALFHHSEAAWISPRSGVTRAVEHLILSRVTMHLPTSHYTGKAGGLKYSVVYPPFNSDIYSKEKAVPARDRRDVLFTGRLVDEKGLSFLRANAEIIRKTLGCDRIMIAGDGEMKSWVETLAREDKAFQYLGRLSRDQVARAMNEAAYVIVPSTHNEPFGIVALEALAASAVLISSNLGGLPEAAGSLGHLYDPSSGSSFQQALIAARAQRDAMLDSPDEEARYRAKLAQHLDGFSPRSIADSFIDSIRPYIRQD